MSDTNKSSLWQKIKQLLSAHAPDAKAANDNAATSAQSDQDSSTDVLAPDRPKTDKNEQVPSSKAAHSETQANKKYDSNADSHTIEKHLGQTDKPETNVQAETVITDSLKDYLDNQQWHYTQYPPKDADTQQTMHLSLRMRHKDIECGYLFRIQERNGLLAVYGILPFLIPDTHQSAAMLLVSQINYDMIIGNLEMDVNDGEIRYKHAIDVEVVGINEPVIDHLLQSVVAMTTVAHDVFSDLLSTEDPSADIPTLLSELQQQTESRTFFLPTQLVQ